MICLSAVLAQASSVKAMCQKQIQGYNELQQAINQFVMSSAELQGKTYDSAKQYFSAVLSPLAKGGMLLSEAVAEACQKFPDEYQAQVDRADLKSSELEEQIQQYQNGIQTANSIIQEVSSSPLPEPAKKMVLKSIKNIKEGQETAKKKLENKLKKLMAFHTSSPSIFSEIAILEAAIEAGAAQAATCWNGSTGTFSVPKDMSWVQNINSYEQRKEIERLAKQYGLSYELAKDLQTFHKRMDEYAKKNGLSPEERQHLYAMLIASLSGAYGDVMWQVAGGTVSVEEAIKKLKEMGYSEKEIQDFREGLRKNHSNEDGVGKNDFVHTMGSLAVILNTDELSNIAMKFGTSGYSTASFGQFLLGNPGFIRTGFLASLFQGDLNKNAAATYRGDIASGKLDVKDVRADIDALNIYYRVKNNPNASMTDIINQYSRDLQKGMNRAEELAKHFGNGDYEKGKENFYKEVHKPITDLGSLVLQVKNKNSIEGVQKAADDFWKIYENELKGK